MTSRRSFIVAAIAIIFVSAVIISLFKYNREPDAVSQKQKESATPGGSFASDTESKPQRLLTVDHKGKEDPSTEKGRSSNPKSAPIAYVNGLLSLNVQNFLLKDVLNEISNQSDVAVITGQIVGNELISISFEELPLDKGLRRILNNNYDLFYYYSAEGQESGVLSVAWVFPKGGGKGFMPLSAALADVTVTKEYNPDNPDPVQRADAIHQLVKNEGEMALDWLYDALEDPDATVRDRAMFAALNSGLKLPSNILQYLVENDSSPVVRSLSLEAIAGNPDFDREKLRALAEDAARDSDSLVKTYAGDILRELNRPPEEEDNGQSFLEEDVNLSQLRLPEDDTALVQYSDEGADQPTPDQNSPDDQPLPNDEIDMDNPVN